MMAVFYLGIGAAVSSVGFVRTPEQLGVALFAVDLFAGTAMLIAHADKLGREVGINGVWGNLGVASSAVVTGVICQFLGWRWAFILPGLGSIAFGIVFMTRVRHEARTANSHQARLRVAKDAEQAWYWRWW